MSTGFDVSILFSRDARISSIFTDSIVFLVAIINTPYVGQYLIYEKSIFLRSRAPAVRSPHHLKITKLLGGGYLSHYHISSESHFFISAGFTCLTCFANLLCL